MKKTAAKKLKEAMKPGRVYRRQELAPYCSSVTREVNTLVVQGEIVRAAHGLYYRPKMTSVGPAPATSEEPVRAFLSDEAFLFLSFNEYNLLISDTHGQLAVINRLAQHVQAGAVIHAGDFGFYDEDSYERLSNRELRLQIIHSTLPMEERNRILKLSPNEQTEAVRHYRLLGDFADNISGINSFQVPVYAVWGNHEDKRVVERLYTKELQLSNLHLLHQNAAFQVGSTLLYGLGGNFLSSSKLLQPTLAGGGGKIWSTLSQYSQLVRTVEAMADFSGLRICVFHVSPGKEPFIEFIAARTRADLTVSGHMGAPTCMVWNPFAISTADQAASRLERGFESTKARCLESAEENSVAVEREFSFIGKLPQEIIKLKRGTTVPRWYREMTHVNLPDADRGYAVLDIVDGRWSLSSFVL